MAELEYLQGDYQISTAINGEASWNNGEYAIWFVSHLATWYIGPLDKIGDDFGQIYGLDYGYGLTYTGNFWTFWNGTDEIRPRHDDIHITCNGKHFKHLTYNDLGHCVAHSSQKGLLVNHDRKESLVIMWSTQTLFNNY